MFYNKETIIIIIIVNKISYQCFLVGLAFCIPVWHVGHSHLPFGTMDIDIPTQPRWNHFMWHDLLSHAIMSPPSLAGHTLHLRRKGLVSCLYATCAAAARSAAPIKSLHVMVLCNIQCHSAARYIPATTHRDTECERVRYMSTTS